MQILFEMKRETLYHAVIIHQIKKGSCIKRKPVLRVTDQVQFIQTRLFSFSWLKA